MAQESNMRKSIIRKSIVRKYNTAKYETMDITVDHQHEIEWDSLDMLRAKSDGITTLLREDFENTQKKVFEELNLNGFSAIISSTVNNNKRALTEEEKKDFDRID